MSKISVVIPLYNKERYISRAINSVLSQTIQDFEIIVIDDGSTDNSAKVIKKIRDDRIRIIQQRNQGECAARNRGIDEVKTSLIAFLDADDEWKPQFLETILRLKTNYPNAGAYATAYERKEPNGQIVRVKFKAIPRYPWEGIIPNYFESALGNPPVCSSATVIPKTVFDTAGKFPVGEKLGGDLDMWLRVSLKYSIAFSNVIGAVYYRNALNRVSPTDYSITQYRFVKTAREAILDSEISDENKVYLAEYISMKEIERAGRCIVKGEINTARQLLIENRTTSFKNKRLLLLLLTFLPIPIVKLFRLFKRIILRQI
ncbi:MAG: glycosyltransferase family 2 protein [Candidatus Omnitrophota bacterium]